MFVLITPPPMITIENNHLTRELTNWLCDYENGWLKDYPLNNVFVFDFYNVLTDPNNHHRVESPHTGRQQEVHRGVCSPFECILPYVETGGMKQRSLIEEYLKGIKRLERVVKRINQIKTPEAIIKNVLKECNSILRLIVS